MPRNVLPQQYGFKPGTSMVGSFGVTERRFRPVPYDGAVEPDNPSPADYSPRGATASGAQGYSWGTSRRRPPSVGGAFTPGPGAYDPTAGGMLLEVQQSWAGRPDASSFGSNQTRSFGSLASEDEPGPASYNATFSTHFVSGSGTGARSPYASAARSATGSRVPRSVDVAPSAVFASSSPAQMALPSSGAATPLRHDTPSPGAYTPLVGFARLALLEACAKHENYSTGRCFGTSAPRFQPLPLSKTTDPDNPGPGAHDTQRWAGAPPTARRPRVGLGRGGAAFDSSDAHRFGEGEAERTQRLAGGLDTATGRSVVHMLAHGSMGPVGSKISRQAAVAALQSKQGSGVRASYPPRTAVRGR